MKQDKVHVIVAGWSPDRLAIGAFRKGADRIYILLGDITDDTKWWNRKSKSIIEELKNKLGKMVEINPVVVNSSDYFECFKQIADIYKKEQKKGSLIFLNISDGRRIISTAAISAASVFNISAYYAIPEKYNKIFQQKGEYISYGCRDIVDVPLIPFGNLSQREKQILKLLYNRNLLLTDLAKEMKLTGSRTKINYYINKLSESNLIKTEQRKGKITVSLSKAGCLVSSALI